MKVELGLGQARDEIGGHRDIVCGITILNHVWRNGTDELETNPPP
jgi:hypothetical protein